MLKALALATGLLLTTPAAAQPQPSGPDAVADAIFKQIKGGDYSKAFQTVGRGTLLEQKSAELQNMANQMSGALQIYGKVTDWEVMTERKWSESYLVRNYLMRTERGPLFFNVHFYRSPTGWVIASMSFTDIPKNLPAP